MGLNQELNRLHTSRQFPARPGHDSMRRWLRRQREDVGGTSMSKVGLRSLGHVVLNVSSLARSVPFYSELLGLQVVGQSSAPLRARLGEIVFLSFGRNHHDLALREVPGLRRADPTAAGLFHVAFSVGETIEELAALHVRLLDAQVEGVRLVDHGHTRSVYFLDPDGLTIECYVGDDELGPSTDLPYEATSSPLQLPPTVSSR